MSKCTKCDMYGCAESFLDLVCRNCLRIDELEKAIEKLLTVKSVEKSEEDRKCFEAHSIQLDAYEKKACKMIEEKFAELVVSRSLVAKEETDKTKEEEWTKKEIKKIRDKVKKVETKIKDSDKHEQRRNNIIIHRMVESAADKEDQKRADDRKEILSMFKVLGVNCESSDIRRVFRLGKESANNRPLLVELKEATTKNLILESLFKLKHAEEKIRRVSVTHDMTKTEREQCRELVKEAKEKQTNDQSGEWIYKVKGIPGNMRIVKLRKMQ